jgi:nucleoside phosphorylase
MGQTGAVTQAQRVAVLAPMPPELKAVVRAGSLRRAPDGPFSHAGKVGRCDVRAALIGMGPSTARSATERVLRSGAFDHVMVVGIAGGLAPDLPVGALMVPSIVRLHPDGPPLHSHPVGGRPAEGTLLTTVGLFSDDGIWGPLAHSGVGALDMEASGVAEACEQSDVPWSVYRGISDRPDEHLVDQAVFALSKPDGSPDFGAVVRFVLRDPRRVKDLAHLNRCMQLAARVAAEAAFADLRAT